MNINVIHVPSTYTADKLWFNGHKATGVAEWSEPSWVEKAKNLRKQGCSTEEISQLIGVDVEAIRGMFNIESFK